MKVAIFDFDGTIYPHETFQVLIKELKHHPEYHNHYKQFMRKFIPVYMGYKLKLVSKLTMQNKAMVYYMSTFKGRSQTEVEAFFNDTAQRMQGELRTVLVERIRMLKENNYYTMLVSGAYVPLLSALFKDNLFDHIAGTEVNYNGGVYQGDQELTRMHAERKVEIIHTHFNNREVDWSASHAYSDSYSDIKMLELVGNPVAVAPDGLLLSVAEKYNWEIYNDS